MNPSMGISTKHKRLANIPNKRNDLKSFHVPSRENFQLEMALSGYSDSSAKDLSLILPSTIIIMGLDKSRILR